MRDQPNPMRELLHQQMGIDAFSLDGDGEMLEETWQDEARAMVPVAIREVEPRRGLAVAPPEFRRVVRQEAQARVGVPLLPPGQPVPPGQGVPPGRVVLSTKPASDRPNLVKR